MEEAFERLAYDFLEPFFTGNARYYPTPYWLGLLLMTIGGVLVGLRGLYVKGYYTISFSFLKPETSFTSPLWPVLPFLRYTTLTLRTAVPPDVAFLTEFVYGPLGVKHTSAHLHGATHLRQLGLAHAVYPLSLNTTGQDGDGAPYKV